MNSYNFNYFWLATLLIGCAPTTDGNKNKEVLLPDVASDALCDEDEVQFSGGDLYTMADRIFVGTVTSVSFVENGLADDCDPRMYEWTLRVELTVEENLKGGEATAVVLVSPHNLQWSSLPLLKRDGDWLPSTGRPPALELSSTVAWTGESAIQVGQTLLIHAKERNGSLFTLGFPWGQAEGEGYRFQAAEWCGFALPENLQNNFTLETIRAELQKAPLVEYRENFLQSGYVSESECRPDTPPTVVESTDVGNSD